MTDNIKAAWGPEEQAKGTLVIAGGGELPDVVFQRFIQAAGGADAVIAILPAATAKQEATVAMLRSHLAPLGAQVRVLDVTTRDDASDPARLEEARTCTGFWLTGGDQNRIGERIVETPLHQLILQRYMDGATVGGTSAGAAAMSQVMIVGGGDASDIAPGAYATREGLGFLTGCIVDMHFLRRQRENRLVSLIQVHLDLLGLGIDEETAVVVHSGRAEVIGNRGVMVLDPSHAEAGGGSIFNLCLHLLGAGQVLDLASRQPLKHSEITA